MAVDPGNEWFVTGSADRTMKIWDLATGQLKLTLTGHIEQVQTPLASPCLNPPAALLLPLPPGLIPSLWLAFVVLLPFLSSVLFVSSLPCSVPTQA